MTNKNFYIGNEIFNEQTDLKSVLRKAWEIDDYETIEEIQTNLKKSVSRENPQDKEETTEEYEDRLLDEMNDVIYFWKINKNSVLWNALNVWFTTRGQHMCSVVRGYVEDAEAMYYMTGMGYDTISSDLLGGEADGKLKDEFLKWINE